MIFYRRSYFIFLALSGLLAYLSAFGAELAFNNLHFYMILLYLTISVIFSFVPLNFSLAYLLNPTLLFTHEDKGSPIVAQCLFLFLVPLFLTLLAVHRFENFSIFLYWYLMFLLFLSSVCPSAEDGFYMRFVACSGFIFIASTQGLLHQFILAFATIFFLLLSTTTFLLLNYYQGHSRTLQRQILYFSIKRNLIVSIAATLPAGLVTVILYGKTQIVYEMAKSFSNPAEAGNLEDKDLLSFGQLLAMALCAAAVYLAINWCVKLVSYLRKRRTGTTAPLKISIPTLHDIGGVFNADELGRGKFSSIRKKIISLYLKTLSILNRAGIWHNPSSAPYEYAGYASSKFDAVKDDLDQLTVIFTAARYGQDEPSMKDAIRAGRLFHSISLEVKKKKK